MDGPPTRMMYSPDTGAAACEPSANIDKKATSKRCFIIESKGLFMRDARLRKGKGAIAEAPMARDHARTARRSVPTNLDRHPSVPNPPTFAACESAQISRRERAPLPATDATCNSKQIGR